MAKVILMEDNTDRFSQIVKSKNGRGGLYLGSQKAATDLNLLKSHSIKAVITIAEELSNKYPPGISHFHIKIGDQPLAHISQYFDPSYMFIKKNMLEGNVFVHCKMGISRSASLVIAYIMRGYRCSFEKVHY